MCDSATCDHHGHTERNNTMHLSSKFPNVKKIIENTPNGIRLTITSDDPHTVEMLQKEAQDEMSGNHTHSHE